MTENHSFPITPPPELVWQWIEEDENGPGMVSRIAARAAQWGADQELEACRAYLLTRPGEDHGILADELRAARRPKSEKQQALEDLDRLIALIPTEGAIAMAEPIRRALESIPDPSQ